MIKYIFKIFHGDLIVDKPNYKMNNLKSQRIQNDPAIKIHYIE